MGWISHIQISVEMTASGDSTHIPSVVKDLSNPTYVCFSTSIHCGEAASKVSRLLLMERWSFLRLFPTTTGYFQKVFSSDVIADVYYKERI